MRTLKIDDIDLVKVSEIYLIVGEPITKEEFDRAQWKRRIQEYDDCLKAFLKSKDDYWKINLSTLPRSPRAVLSSMRWRTQHIQEFMGIRVYIRKDILYLEKIKTLDSL